MTYLDKLAEAVANKVKEKLQQDKDEDKRPGLMSPQLMAETGVDALEIAVRKFIASR